MFTERFRNHNEEIPKRLGPHFDAIKKAAIRSDEQALLEELIELRYCLPHEDDRKMIDLSKKPNPIQRINGILNGLIEIREHACFQRLSPQIKHHLDQLIQAAESRMNTIITIELRQNTFF